MTAHHMQATMFKTSVLAGLMGAGLALLFAPKSGRETRQQLKETAVKMNHRLDKKKDSLEDAVMAGAEVAQEKMDAVQDKLLDRKAAKREADMFNEEGR